MIENTTWKWKCLLMQKKPSLTNLSVRECGKHFGKMPFYAEQIKRQIYRERESEREREK